VLLARLAAQTLYVTVLLPTEHIADITNQMGQWVKWVTCLDGSVGHGLLRVDQLVTVK